MSDDRMTLVFELRTKKKTGEQFKYKMTFLKQEEIEQMLLDAIDVLDVDMIPTDSVQVVAHIIRAGGRATPVQEYPCKTDRIRKLIPLISRGLRASLTEPDKEDLPTQLNRGKDKIFAYGEIGVSSILTLKKYVSALGLGGQPANPMALVGALQDTMSLVSGAGAGAGSVDSGAAGGGGGDGLASIMGPLMAMMSNPDGATPEMLNGIMQGLASNPETAPFAQAVSGLLGGLK